MLWWRQTPPLIEFGWEFRVPEPGFARVDPLRGRVSGLLQERDHERSGKIPSAQVSIETGQLHYVALRGTRAPPTCTRTCAFEGPLGSPRRAIQPSSREKTAHDLRVGELQWPPEDGENVTNRTVNAPLKTGQNAEIGNAAVRAASGERAARARLPITVIDRQSLGEALAWWRKSYAT